MSYNPLNTKENWFSISSFKPVKYVFKLVLLELPNQDLVLVVVAIVWYALPWKSFLAFFNKASAKVIPESFNSRDTDFFPNNPPSAEFNVFPNKPLICPTIGILDVIEFIGLITELINEFEETLFLNENIGTVTTYTINLSTDITIFKYRIILSSIKNGTIESYYNYDHTINV